MNNEEEQTYYKILKISKNANSSEILLAFAKLSDMYSFLSSMANGEERRTRFLAQLLKAKEAYSILTNKLARKEYNDYLRQNNGRHINLNVEDYQKYYEEYEKIKQFLIKRFQRNNMKSKIIFFSSLQQLQTNAEKLTLKRPTVKELRILKNMR